MRASLPSWAVVALAGDELDVHAETGCGLLDGVAKTPHVAGSGHEDAEDQRTTKHDLLDVEHLDRSVRQRVEHRRCHARSVSPHQCDEDGLGLIAGHERAGYRPSKDEQAATIAARDARCSGASAARRCSASQADTEPPS